MKRMELKELGLTKELVDKIMNLHQKDIEKNKKKLILKDRNIIRIEKQLDKANICISSLSMEMKKYEKVNLEDIELLRQELLLKKKEAKIRELLDKVQLVNNLIKEDVLKEYLTQDTLETIDVDGFIVYVTNLYSKWLTIILPNNLTSKGEII